MHDPSNRHRASCISCGPRVAAADHMQQLPVACHCSGEVARLSLLLGHRDQAGVGLGGAAADLLEVVELER